MSATPPAKKRAAERLDPLVVWKDVADHDICHAVLCLGF